MYIYIYKYIQCVYTYIYIYIYNVPHQEDIIRAREAAEASKAWKHAGMSVKHALQCILCRVVCIYIYIYIRAHICVYIYIYIYVYTY